MTRPPNTLAAVARALSDGVSKGLYTYAEAEAVIIETALDTDVAESDARAIITEHLRPPPASGWRFYSDVVKREVRWLWNLRIPLGKLSILDGDPGLGKSTAALDIAARVSRGDEMPDGRTGAWGCCLILSAEDDAEDTLQPRLEAAGADMGRCIDYYGVEQPDGSMLPPVYPHNLPSLETCIEENNAVLVVLDPLVAFIGAEEGSTDTHRDSDVRRMLHPIARTAQRTGCAFLGIRHHNKGQGKAVHRGAGSIAFSGAARTVHLIAEDPDDPTMRVWAGVKNNLAAPSPALSFEVIQEGGASRIQWLGTCDYSADALCQEKKGPSKSEVAKEFLRDTLANGSVRTAEVEAKAEARGISLATLSRARGALGVVAEQGYGGQWKLTLSSNQMME